MIRIYDNMNGMEIHAIIRKTGLKATPARVAILRILHKNRHPMSAQEIIEKLGPTVNQATVYRFMKGAANAGIIKQIDLRQNHARFEIFDEADHHHLVCVYCGKVRDVADCGIGDMHSKILQKAHDFAHIREHSLEFYGICKHCLQKRRKS